MSLKVQWEGNMQNHPKERQDGEKCLERQAGETADPGSMRESPRLENDCAFCGPQRAGTCAFKP